MKNTIVTLVTDALHHIAPNNSLLATRSFTVEPCKDPQHGDFACNAALVLAKPLSMSPIALAEAIKAQLSQSDVIHAVTIAGPGFLNFTLAQQVVTQVIDDILRQGDQFGQQTFGQGQRVHCEFVSANPTGPLHVGHGRHAATGSAIASLLRTVGFEVHTEYYVNDAGRQMDILAMSVWLSYLALIDTRTPLQLPQKAYRGEYIQTIAADLLHQHGQVFFNDTPVATIVAADEDDEQIIDQLIRHCKACLGEAYTQVQAFAQSAILTTIRTDLADFNVTFDHWFSEQSLYDSGALEQAMTALSTQGCTYQQAGATWFKAMQFGDEKDRVLIRANASPTYFASDCAYHLNKISRGFTRLIDVMGADHHGYISRLRGLLSASQVDNDTLEVVLVQFANLFRSGQKVQMSTRSGEFVTLRALMEEVGTDAARFFYIYRKPDQHLDFDLDLAKKQSNDNPVYYIQYAHARIASVLRQQQARAAPEATSTDLMQLNTPAEQALLKCLAHYPEMLLQAARTLSPHRVANYLRELATCFHSYYNAHILLVEERSLCSARLALAKATQIVLCNGLTVLGLTAPDMM